LLAATDAVAVEAPDGFGPKARFAKHTNRIAVKHANKTRHGLNVRWIMGYLYQVPPPKKEQNGGKPTQSVFGGAASLGLKWISMSKDRVKAISFSNGLDENSTS
jgi:hypothetical protein